MMASSKRTTIAEAIKKFEEKYQVTAAQASEVLLYGQLPPIDKMDSSLSVLYPNCKKLSLSSNVISIISNCAGFHRLEILSLGRNNIKNITSLEPVAGTLQQLWISYNQVEKLAGLTCLKHLKVLYMSNNKVKDMAEFERLAELPCLEDLHFVGNPLEDRLTKEGRWRSEVARILPRLKRLDGTFHHPPDALSPQPTAAAEPPDAPSQSTPS